jgi:3-isopropylmalate/(R)-2-methylmalate dehydratase small subunit
MNKIKGNVWVFGNDINTDAIVPGAYISSPMEEVVKHVLESENPNFPRDFKQGDIIAAGSNFGCGSSRENAPEALKKMGIGAIIVKSFARIFFRNAVALGIPVLTVDTSPEGFSQGDMVEIDVENVSIKNLTTDSTIIGTPLYKDILDVIKMGGIVPLMKDMVNRHSA